jgi:hypothetical protein
MTPTKSVRVALGMALIAGTALLSGCGPDPAPITQTTTTTERTTTTPAMVPPASTTTTTETTRMP